MTTTEDVRRSIYSLASRALPADELLRSAVRVLRRAMVVDGWCGLTLDPATLLPTGGVHEEGVPAGYLPRLIELEHAVPDAFIIRDLARSTSPVGVLSSTTRSESARYNEVLAPVGFVDELRSALRVDGHTWGGLVLFRSDGEFDSGEADLVRDVSVYLAAAVRRSLTGDGETEAPVPDGPGVVVLHGERLDAITPAAVAWLESLGEAPIAGPDGLPPAVLGVAMAARRAARTGEKDGTRARTRTRSGRWLLLQGAALDEDGDRVAVTIEAADPVKVAPLVMEAYDLSPREQEVVALLLRGHATREISAALFVSEHTVQDHLKSVFAKMGVSSRRELLSALLYRHYLA